MRNYYTGKILCVGTVAKHSRGTHKKAGKHVIIPLKEADDFPIGSMVDIYLRCPPDYPDWWKEFLADCKKIQDGGSKDE